MWDRYSSSRDNHTENVRRYRIVQVLVTNAVIVRENYQERKSYRDITPLSDLGFQTKYIVGIGLAVG